MKQKLEDFDIISHFMGVIERIDYVFEAEEFNRQHSGESFMPILFAEKMILNILDFEI